MPILGSCRPTGQGRQADKRQELPTRAGDKADGDGHLAHNGEEAPCQGMRTMASMGKRPAPTINSAEKDHMARFRRGMSQVSQGL